MRILLPVLLLLVTNTVFAQGFTTPIGTAATPVVDATKVNQFVQESIHAMNRPGGMERYARNVMKVVVGSDNLPKGTETITLGVAKYKTIFDFDPASKSLWMRTVLDPLIWDIKHERMGPVSTDAYPAAVVAATYVVKNPVKIEYYLEKADYKTRQTAPPVDLEGDW